MKPYKTHVCGHARKNTENHKTSKALQNIAALSIDILNYALSDCQTTIVVTSIDIHVLTLSPCQNFQ